MESQEDRDKILSLVLELTTPEQREASLLAWLAVLRNLQKTERVEMKKMNSWTEGPDFVF